MADDSGSMKAAENGTRIDDLQAMLVRITGDKSILIETSKTCIPFLLSCMHPLQSIDSLFPTSSSLRRRIGKEKKRKENLK
jgi:hypothetical protein